MRHPALLFALILLAIPPAAHSAAPSATQPATAPSPKPAAITRNQAADALDLPPEKQAALRKAIADHAKQVTEWNNTHLKEYNAVRGSLSNPRATNAPKDAPHVNREILLRCSELLDSREAIDAEFAAAAGKILTPDEFKKFTDLTTPRPLAPRPLHSYTIRVDKPNFTPQRVRAIYAAFDQMLADLPADKNTAIDRDLAIQAALLKTLGLFPPGQQLGIIQWYSTTPNTPFATPFFRLTDDQAAKIRQTAAQMKNQPQGVSAAAAASQALNTMLDTLTHDQKHRLFRQFFDGEPGDIITFPPVDGPPLPANIRMKPRRALEALDLPADLHAHASKALQTHLAWLKEHDDQVAPLTRDLLKARRADDQAAVLDLEKRLAAFRPAREAAIARFEKDFKQLLTPPVYRQYLDNLDAQKADQW